METLGEAVPGLWRCRGVMVSQSCIYPCLATARSGEFLQWGLESLGVCWYPLQVERRVLQKEGRRGVW